METPEDLFKGIRPSDLRFDNVHILAAYIARAQRFADCATRIETSAEQLLRGAIETSEEGVRQFETVVQQMRSEFKGLQSQLTSVVDTMGRHIARAVIAAHKDGASCILQAGEEAKQRYRGLDDRADEVRLAAKRLEEAAENAEATRLRAHEELDQLRAFKSELVRFERESLTRISDARARLYEGVGLWQRVSYVPFPPVPVVRASKAPTRPSVLSRAAKTPNAFGKMQDSGAGHAGDAAPAGGVRRK